MAAWCYSIEEQEISMWEAPWIHKHHNVAFDSSGHSASYLGVCAACVHWLVRVSPPIVHHDSGVERHQTRDDELVLVMFLPCSARES